MTIFAPAYCDILHEFHPSFPRPGISQLKLLHVRVTENEQWRNRQPNFVPRSNGNEETKLLVTEKLSPVSCYENSYYQYRHFSLVVLAPIKLINSRRKRERNCAVFLLLSIMHFKYINESCRVYRRCPCSTIVQKSTLFASQGKEIAVDPYFVCNCKKNCSLANWEHLAPRYETVETKRMNERVPAHTIEGNCISYNLAAALS